MERILLFRIKIYLFLYNLLGDIMKKFFTLLGIFTLGCTSFIYTEKTVSVLNENDEIMIKINENIKNLETDPVEAKINGNTIIPGLSGKKVDKNKSYRIMKNYGTYNKNLFEYNYIKPNIKLMDNINKFVISGNQSKNMVSLMFIVNENDNINEIVSILDNKKVKALFFVDGNFLENNRELIMSLINKGHEIGNLSYNMDYNDSSFSWMNIVINNMSKKKIGYCYHENENLSALNICALYKNISIKPTFVVNNNPAMTVKDNLVSGSLIAFKISNSLNNELGAIINYIYSKGFKIDSVASHLSE